MFAVQLLDRRVGRPYAHLLQAWDEASAALRAGWPRVAIVRANNPSEIVMVLQRVPVEVKP